LDTLLDTPGHPDGTLARLWLTFLLRDGVGCLERRLGALSSCFALMLPAVWRALVSCLHAQTQTHSVAIHTLSTTCSLPAVCHTSTHARSIHETPDSMLSSSMPERMCFCVCIAIPHRSCLCCQFEMEATSETTRSSVRRCDALGTLDCRRHTHTHSHPLSLRSLASRHEKELCARRNWGALSAV
jgi:hypothetical protein